MGAVVGFSKFGEAVQQDDAGSLAIEAGFEDVHLDAVVVVDDAGADAGRKRVGAVEDVEVAVSGDGAST